MANRTRKARFSSKYAWFMAAVVFLLFIGFFIFNKPAVAPVQPASSGPTTFQASSAMGGFTIEVPEGYEVEEKNTIVILKKNNSAINIYKTGTNFISLKDIFNSDKDLRNKKINYFKINNLEAGSELLANQKNYYIYSYYQLFSITTDNPNLFSDLDQIAQTFRIAK